MLQGIFNRLAAFTLFAQLQKTGWAAFVLLGFLPFIGVVFLGWSVEVVLLSYFIDRLVYIFYLFLADEIHRIRSRRFIVQDFVRTFIVFLVVMYMLLQFVGLIASLTGALKNASITTELIQVLVSIAVLYGIPWAQSFWKTDSAKWEFQFFRQSVGLVLVSGATFMIAFIGGVFLVNTIRDTFLASFFKNGYGIVIFIFVLLRLSTDAFFFTIKRKQKRSEQSPNINSSSQQY
ncbi:hypothetical protein EP331_02010 [bacterium]|nr:MAG: hypothetical protein EP331_02010 [bacterium]